MVAPRLFPCHAFTSFVAYRSASPCPQKIFSGAFHRAQRHREASPQHSRSLTGGTNHLPPRRQYSPEEPLQDKKQAEAVPRELPSSRGGGPWISSGSFGGGGRGHRIRDAILTSVCSIAVLFAGGVVYVDWYKENVLRKIDRAFSVEYDPILELAKHATPGPWTQHLRHAEQDAIDRIVQGNEVGQYFILLGPKGTGKTTMIFDAMQAIQGEGVAMCDAHPDAEVFRLRLGKALNYEYHEDSQTGFFQRRDPREGGPALDIERALNKLEIVAIKHKKVKGKPLVLIINNAHFFNHDDDGRNILLQLQQRAEAWAASSILTMVFSSKESFDAAMRMRNNVDHPPLDPDIFEQIFNIVGGRLTYIGRVTKKADMLKHAKHLLAVEKAWLLSQIGLIPDYDHTVVDEQTRRQEDVVRVKEQIERGEAKPEDLDNLPLPRISYVRSCFYTTRWFGADVSRRSFLFQYEARQIMTRADFMDELDRKNIITIDINHDLTPDSMLILRAAEEVCAEEGFDELLEGVRRRVDEIQSSQRIREVTFKEAYKGDRIRLKVDKGGARLMEG
ncbi:hypothetical protein V8D89_003345 [Ganoderma adspersum]